MEKAECAGVIGVVTLVLPRSRAHAKENVIASVRAGR
jgi:hypothetical protein